MEEQSVQVFVGKSKMYMGTESAVWVEQKWWEMQLDKGSWIKVILRNFVSKYEVIA